jgi:hypothetical protein
MKKILKIVPFLTIAILVGVTVAYAGNLTSPGTPAKTMKTISDLYELVNTGANTPSTDFTTPATVSPTMNSIGDTYDLLTTKIAAINPSTILTGTTIFGKAGTATAGASAPTWSSADVTSYDCSWFNTMTDSTQPGVTSADICGYNSGCNWDPVALTCGGGIQTPSPAYITWYAGEAACANSTEGGQTAGTWRLPTYPELVGYYLSSNGTPSGFQSGYYWSGTTYPNGSIFAYRVGMDGGFANGYSKSLPNLLVHCAR